LEPPADSEPHAVNTLNASTCPNARTKHSVLLILVSSPCWNGDRTTGALLPSLGNVRDGVFVEVVASAVLNQEINGGFCCWIPDTVDFVRRNRSDMGSPSNQLDRGGRLLEVDEQLALEAHRFVGDVRVPMPRPDLSWAEPEDT